MLFFMFTFVAFAAAGQGGDPEVREIIQSWQDHYEASIENIDDFVVVMDQQTLHYKKTWDNGRPYFKSRVVDADEQEVVSGSNLTDAEVFSRVYEAVMQDGEYKGTDEMNGHSVHVIYIEKGENIVDEPWAPHTFEDVYLRIDIGDWVLRELEYKAHIEHEGEQRIINQVIQQRDYRDVEGMQYPYETVVIIRGLALTEEERQEAEEGLAEFERQMETMPEAQRRMVEQMAGDKIERFRQMLEDDLYETVNRVREVRVNTGMDDF
ncbi:MAG: hypothetical protein RG741_01415 [Bacteroidales bacterium]|nr:hypothetical protein [Bacteroidales bacterium]